MTQSEKQLLLGTARTLRALIIMFMKRESFAPFHNGLVDLQRGLDECLEQFQPSPILEEFLAEMRNTN
jgi:hypothetical protein